MGIAGAGLSVMGVLIAENARDDFEKGGDEIERVFVFATNEQESAVFNELMEVMARHGV